MTLAKSLFAVSLACVSYAAYACDHPSLVEIPENVEEGRDTERVREATQAYVQNMTAYTECIQAEMAALGDNPTPLQQRLLVARNNSAVAEVEFMLELYEQRVEPITALQGAPAN
jgi:hypothetical protein